MAVFEKKQNASGTIYAPEGSGQVYIPFAWLLKCELAQDGKMMVAHYTHAIVTIKGHDLGKLHEAMADQTLAKVEGRSGAGGKLFVNEILIEDREGEGD